MRLRVSLPELDVFSRLIRLCFAELLKMQGQRFLAAAVVFVFVTVGVAIYGSASESPRAGAGEGTVEVDLEPETGGAGREPATAETRGFAVLAIGWKWGCRAVAIVVLIAGSLLISTEFAQGTLKLALSRPVRRCEVFLAKCVVLAAFAVVLAVVVLGGTWAYVGLAFGFSDVHDPKYPDFVHFSRAAMTNAALHAALLSILPIVCLGAMGLLVSAFSPGSGTSVAFAILLHLVLDVMNEYLSVEVTSWLFSYYLRMPTDILCEMSQAFSTRASVLYSNASVTEGVGWLHTVAFDSKLLIVPLVSAVVLTCLAALVFWRRDVPA